MSGQEQLPGSTLGSNYISTAHDGNEHRINVKVPGIMTKTLHQKAIALPLMARSPHTMME